ncbi:MAG TPA: alpha/beta hydrolase domain-containing protein [Bryobacteraceae bacterium]|nr:alpha/beta hydrolase domain-containing protein [Bryobacteraceae bacterium]
MSGKGGPNPNVQYPTNDQQVRWFMNAALVAMNDWISKGMEPPPSRYPSVAHGELTDLAGLKFPKLAGVHPPAKVYRPRVLDFGPAFATTGIISIEPPKEGEFYTTLIPQVDSDGNEIAGIHLPQVSVPLGTYTAWNLRSPKIGAPDATFTNIGSTFPFALTKAERDRSGDPRPSIEERYQSEKDYLAKTEAAARELVKQRYVLERDVPHIVDFAQERWRTLTSQEQARK